MVGLDKDALENKVSSLKRKLNQNRRKLQDMFEKLDKMRKSATELKVKRDKVNQEVKKFVGEGKAHQQSRDELQKIILFLKLKKKLKDQLTTLVTIELNLKDELVLFDMICELRDQYQTKKQAMPSKIEIDNTENLDEKIAKLRAQHEDHHKQALDKFKMKDELRKQSESYHKQMLEHYSKIKDKQAEADAFKQLVKKAEQEFNKYNKEIMKIKNVELAKVRETRLQIAKEKKAKKGKLDLEELKLLMEEGEL